MKKLLLGLALMLPISFLANSISESTKNPPIKYLEPCFFLYDFKPECPLPFAQLGSVYKLSVCENYYVPISRVIENIQDYICEFKEFPSYVTVIEIDYETTPFPGGTYL